MTLQELYERRNEQSGNQLLFGRFPNLIKDPGQPVSLEYADERFTGENFLTLAESTLNYLTVGRENNLQFEKKGDQIHFTIFQGKKRIRGKFADCKLSVESDLVRMEKPDGGVMAYLFNLHLADLYAHVSYHHQYLRLRVEEDLQFCTPRFVNFVFDEIARNADTFTRRLQEKFPIWKLVT